MGALASLARCRGTRRRLFFQVTPTHKRAKACPMRPLQHQKHKKFTTTQRDAWLGHVICAAKQVGTSQDFQRSLGRWCAKNIDVYAPFVDDYAETRNIRLMKEDTYRYMPSVSSG